MRYFFSPSLCGLYNDAVHKTMPDDVNEITQEVYDACRGQHVVAGPDGMPQLFAEQPPSLDARIAALQAAVDEHLNSAARARRYDSIHTAALRAGFPGPFHAEGLAFATWMDAVNAKCYAVLAQYLGGAITEPTREELLAMLPALILPDSEGA